LIGIGGSLATPPLPHHRAYGSVPRRFDGSSGVGKQHRVVRGRWPPSELRTLVVETRGFTRYRRHLRPARAGFSAGWSRRDHRCYFTSIVRAFGGRKGTRLLRPLLTSAVRSDHLSMASVAEATHGRSPGVSSVAFRAQSPDLRFAPLMDMDFAVRRPLVRCWRLISGSCPSTRTFAPRFFQTPPRGGLRPCALLVLPSRPGEFHLGPLTDSGRDTLASSGSCHRLKAAAFRQDMRLFRFPVDRISASMTHPIGIEIGRAPL